jgi:hypothetical protein
MRDERQLREILNCGNQRARDMARRNMDKIKEIVGLV